MYVRQGEQQSTGYIYNASLRKDDYLRRILYDINYDPVLQVM